jgi:hypothetical protein
VSVLLAALLVVSGVLTVSVLTARRAGAAPPKQTQTTVTSSGSPAAEGTTVTFTATVIRKGVGTADPTSGTVTFFDGGIELGTASVGPSHQAAFATSSLALGTHSIVATFAGDADFAASTSEPLTQVVALPTTTTTVSSDLDPAQFGQTVTFTAAVATTVGTPTGTVEFRDGGTPIAACDAQPLILGVATCATNTLSIGTHAITAAYSGDGTYPASTSSILSQDVEPLATATALSADVNPSTFGDLVTYTSVVSAPAGAAPTTGTVTFYDGVDVLGSVALDASAVATLSTDALAAGTHTVTAVFEGTATHAPSTSAVLSQEVDVAGTTTTVTFVSNPSAFGESVTFTATVTPDPGAGTVQFTVDGVGLGAPVPVGPGGAAVSAAVSDLTVGAHDVDAAFSGTANHAPSIGSLVQNVVAAPTSTTLDSDTNPSVYGDTVTFDATVSLADLEPTGTVTFSSDGVPLAGCTSEPLTAGVATCTTDDLDAGSRSITADYSGGTGFEASSATPLVQAVGRAPSGTTIDSSAETSVYGVDVTVTATVTGAPAGGVPTGSVQFLVDGVEFGTPVPLSAGTAVVVLSGLGAGEHDVHAAYSGNSNYDASSSSITQTVLRADTTTTLESDLNPSAFGATVSFTATVSPMPAAGAVQFAIDGVPAGSPVPLTSGTAIFATSTLASGSRAITATFSGSANFKDSTAGVTQTVIAPPAPPIVEKSGYWMVGRDGAVFAFGDVAYLGGTTVGDVVDIEPTPSGNGYWILTGNGTLFRFGDAPDFGDARGQLRAGERIVSMSTLPGNDGYWLFTNLGRVIAFGSAQFLGDLSAIRLNGPVLGSIATPTGQGYYMVASDGGVFAYGDAAFYGSMGSTRLNAPVTGLVPDRDNVGYWLVASDGGVFSFDAAFWGSMGGHHLNKPVIGMVGFGNGYLMVAEDGGIFDFSDKPFHGSLGGNPHWAPIVSVAAHAEP